MKQEKDKAFLVDIAERLLMTRGIKSVTVDDISQYAGISKKTFYQYHKDKDEVITLIILKVIRSLKAELTMDHEINLSFDKNLNGLSIIFKRIFEMRHFLNDRALSSHSASLTLLEEFKDVYLADLLSTHFQYGISRGWYKNNMRVETMVAMLITQVELILNFPRYKIAMALNAIDLYVEAIVNQSCPKIQMV